MPGWTSEMRASTAKPSVASTKGVNILSRAELSKTHWTVRESAAWMVVRPQSSWNFCGAPGLSSPVPYCLDVRRMRCHFWFFSEFSRRNFSLLRLECLLFKIGNPFRRWQIQNHFAPIKAYCQLHVWAILQLPLRTFIQSLWRRKALSRLTNRKLRHHVFSHCLRRGTASRENVCNVLHQTRLRLLGKRQFKMLATRNRALKFVRTDLTTRHLVLDFGLS